MKKKGKCTSYIQLFYCDDATNTAVPIGGAGFLTRSEGDRAWANVPTCRGESDFMADRMDANRDIVDDKQVSAETCERLMGKPIDQLISEGRARLAAELAKPAAA